jgi:hypothetical protein
VLRWLRAIASLDPAYDRWGFVRIAPEPELVRIDFTPASLLSARHEEDRDGAPPEVGFHLDLATTLDEDRAQLSARIGGGGRSGNAVSLRFDQRADTLGGARFRRLMTESALCWSPTHISFRPESVMQRSIDRQMTANRARGKPDDKLEVGWMTYVASTQLPPLPHEAHVERVGEGSLIVLAEDRVSVANEAQMKLADDVHAALAARGLLEFP